MQNVTMHERDRLSRNRRTSAAVCSGWALALALPMLLMLSACGGSESTNPTDPSVATVAGLDANSDGVRDDVETYINQAASDTPSRSALRQFAKAAQASMLDAGNESLSAIHATERFRAIECLMARRSADYPTLFTDLRARILNTALRTAAYLQADGQVTAIAPQLQPASEWAAACTNV